MTLIWLTVNTFYLTNNFDKNGRYSARVRAICEWPQPLYSRLQKIDTPKIDTFYEISRNFEKFNNTLFGFNKSVQWRIIREWETGIIPFDISMRPQIFDIWIFDKKADLNHSNAYETLTEMGKFLKNLLNSLVCASTYADNFRVTNCDSNVSNVLVLFLSSIFTVTVRDEYIPHNTRWQCTAKTFFMARLDAFMLNLT